MVKFYTENEVELRETKTFLYGLFYGFFFMTLFIMFVLIPGKYTLFDAATISGVCSLVGLIIIIIANRN